MRRTGVSVSYLKENPDAASFDCNSEQGSFCEAPLFVELPGAV